VPPHLLHHPRGEVARVGGDEAQPPQARQARHAVEQVGEVPIPARLAPVVHRLSQQLDLLEAVVEEVPDLAQDLLHRPAPLGAAGLGDDAEGAILVAPLDDGHHPLVLAVAGDRVDVVMPALRETGGDHPLAGPALRHHLLELADARRPEHEVEIGNPAQGPLPLLLGHAAAEADQQALFAFFEQAVLPQPGVDLLLRLLPHAAGVEEDDVRLPGLAGGEDPLLHELAGHALAVQLVHLAAPGLDVEAAGRSHRRAPGPGGGVRAASPSITGGSIDCTAGTGSFFLAASSAGSSSIPSSSQPGRAAADLPSSRN
jgi:hypothetical protein